MDEVRRTHINTVNATNALIAEEIDKLDAGEIDHLNVGVIENLIIQQRTLPVLPIQTSENAPQVFVGRESDLDALITRLRLDAPQQDPIDVIAIHGMPGVGKTALLSALAYHPTVRSALSDGVLRVDLGPEPDILTNQLSWGYELGEDLSNYPTVASRKMRLLALCANKKLLIILDNVWQAEAAKSFLISGPSCRTIIATRNIELAIALAGKEIYRLMPLSPSASLELLNSLTPIAQEIDPASMEELNSSLSGLPLALNMVGQTIDWVWRNGGNASSVLKDLREREARLRVSSLTDSLSAGKEEHTIRSVFQVSYERLPDESIRRAFRQLGVFNYQPAIFDLKAASAIWKLPFSQAQKAILILSSRALIEPVGLERYMLHALLADFATSLYSELELKQFLDSKQCQAVYYLMVARHYRNTGVERWRELDKDWNNVRAAATWVSQEVLNGREDPWFWRLSAGYATVLERVIQTRKTQDSELWLKAGTQGSRRLGRVENQAWLNLTLGSGKSDAFWFHISL